MKRILLITAAVLFRDETCLLKNISFEQYVRYRYDRLGTIFTEWWIRRRLARYRTVFSM